MTTDNRPLRSWMFVPGDKQRFLDKAEVSGADAVMFDLEDGVIWAQKPVARKMVAAQLERAWKGPKRYVRVNAASTGVLADDIAAVACKGLDGICLTKVESAADVMLAAGMLELAEQQHGIPKGQVRILAAIESANSLLNARAIATAHPRVIRLLL